MGVLPRSGWTSLRQLAGSSSPSKVLCQRLSLFRRTDALALARATSQPKKDGQFDAPPYEDVPTFLMKLRARKLSMSRLALEWRLLTAARSGEACGACWSELSADRMVWTIPA